MAAHDIFLALQTLLFQPGVQVIETVEPGGGVVVNSRQGHTTKERKGRIVPVTKRLGRLGRIRLHEKRVRVRQRHRKIAQLSLDTADHAQSLAKIHLSMAGSMRKRHENLEVPALLPPNIIRHDRQTASETMLVPKPLKNSLRRMTLLLLTALIVQKNLIDDPDKRIKLGTSRRTLRRFPGGKECFRIFDTVLRSSPN